MALITPPVVGLAQTGSVINITVTYSGINTGTDLPAELTITRRYESEVNFSIARVVVITDNGPIVVNDPIQEIGLTQYRVVTKNRDVTMVSEIAPVTDSITTT